MIIPTRISVLGRDYEVKYTKNLGEGQYVGLCDHNERTIQLNPDSECDVFATFLHECIHAVLDRAGVRQTPSWTADIEEVICETLSSFLVEEGPKLFRKKRR